MRYLLVVASALLASSCAEAKPLDFKAPETWLGNDEARTGRKLSFFGNTTVYIGTAKGCLLPKTFNLDGSRNWKRFDPEWADVESLFNGSMSAGDPPPMAPLIGSLRMDTSYYGPTNPSTRATVKYNYASPDCLIERGELSKEFLGTLRDWPSNIRIYIHSGKYPPDFKQDEYSGLELREFKLARNEKSYCTIRLGVTVNEIRRARIDVLTSAHVSPRYSDAEAIDCMVRGTIAAFGYLGILRFQFDELYRPENLPQPGKPNRDYIGYLLKGFETYNIENRMFR